MSIYLGNTGLVYLQRPGGAKYSEAITSVNVDTANDKLLLNTVTSFVTGDLVRFTDAGGGSITFLPGDPASPVDRYINVDPVNGWRLYSTWESAMKGDSTYENLETSTAFTLETESQVQNERLLAEVTGFEFSTSKTTADVLSLGEEFLSRVPGAISGAGSISCFWSFDGSTSGKEQARYCSELVVSTGDAQPFTAALVLVPKNVASENGDAAGVADKDLFFRINAYIRDAALSFAVGEAVQARLNFVTTGAMELIYEDVSSYFA